MSVKDPFEVIANCTDEEQLRNIIGNAKRGGREDLVRAAFARICELAGKNSPVEVERDFETTLAAYEELLRQKHGRKQSLSYTRRKFVETGGVRQRHKGVRKRIRVDARRGAAEINDHRVSTQKSKIYVRHMPQSHGGLWLHIWQAKTCSTFQG